MSCMRNAVLVLILIMICGEPAFAWSDEPQKPELKLISPLAVVPGATTRVTLRGLRIDQATEVRTSDGAASCKITLISQSASAPPGGLDAQRVGDTEVQIDLELPSDCALKELTLLVATPAGESMPLGVKIIAASDLLSETEPNDGYKAPQALEPGKMLLGVIHEAKNVDVFHVRATAGQTITAEVWSRQGHAPLDPLLVLCDSRGTILATEDDRLENRDPVLQWQAPGDGEYLLCLLDANDTGSAWHQYLLTTSVQ